MEDIRLDLRGETPAPESAIKQKSNVHDSLAEGYNLVLSGDEDDMALPGVSGNVGILGDFNTVTHNNSSLLKKAAEQQAGTSNSLII